MKKYMGCKRLKIFVTGAKGMLGRDVCALLEAQGHTVEPSEIDDLDLCDLNAVLARISHVGPEVIINCAAYTNVDGCETNIDEAYKGNAVIPANLAIAANKLQAVLVHISTDYVFDGESQVPYVECDSPNPTSIYGKSKRLGEMNVMGLTHRYFILRTQWLYGKHGKNFVKTMLSLAENHSSLKVVNDQFGAPTYTRDLAEAIATIITTESYGVFHVSNASHSSYCSWYQFTVDIMEIAGIDIPIIPCSSDDFPRPAKRPKFSVLDNTYFKACGFTPLRHYKEALRAYLEEELQ